MRRRNAGGRSRERSRSLPASGEGRVIVGQMYHIGSVDALSTSLFLEWQRILTVRNQTVPVEQVPLPGVFSPVLRNPRRFARPVDVGEPGLSHFWQRLGRHGSTPQMSTVYINTT